MAAFVHDLQGTFDGVVGAVRRSDAISSLFSGSSLGKHFEASDADYIVGDFIGVLGESAHSQVAHPGRGYNENKERPSNSTTVVVTASMQGCTGGGGG